MPRDTDRELLEAAARAAGKFVLPEPWPDVDGWFFCEQHGQPAMHLRKFDKRQSFHAEPWMPLTDDADAFRLAVNLAMTVMVDPEDRCVFVVWHCGITAKQPLPEHAGKEALAATRRAIVRCAALVAERLAEKGSAATTSPDEKAVVSPSLQGVAEPNKEQGNG